MFGAPRVYALDIETDTDGVNGLDPFESSVTEISISLDGEDLVFADADEADLLRAADGALRQLPPGLLVTWNGVFFDLPFLDVRARELGPRLPGGLGLTLLPAPGLTPKYELIGGFATAVTGVWQAAGPSAAHVHQHLDISFAYRQLAADLGVPWRLKAVGTALGIEMIEVDRLNMHLLTAQERHNYVVSDTRGTRQLALRALGLA